MNDLFLNWHLGAGDALVCNAIVRHLAKSQTVVVPVKPHNLASVSFMLRDLRNVDILTLDKTDPDGEADKLASWASAYGYRLLGLGFKGSPPFSAKTWDRDMYRQAGVPFSQCWSHFVVDRQPSRELPLPDVDEYIFVHEDKSRGFLIDPKKLPKKVHRVYADPKLTNNIFDWWNIIEHAAEIHCFDSSFAILVDHLPEKEATRLVMHDYARHGNPPTYQNQWVHLK